MLGGFLGAGKTTAIARLARHYIASGRKVGLITNDQAYELVDTQSLRSQGFLVGQIPGACFCCKFDALIDTAKRLTEENAPDVIIAEPVGSCTDLVATVIEPMRHLYGDRYRISPLAVLLKPEHGQKILRDEPGLGFSPKAAYIFLKQIEEADVVAINKIDKLSTSERDELVGLVQRRFPDKRVMAISALVGTGFSELIEAVGHAGARHKRMMEVDYDIYAEGEAELGWFNGVVHLADVDNVPFDLDGLLVALLKRLQVALREQSAEVAHLKILGIADGETSIVNLVDSGSDVELSRASGVHAAAARVTINARVAIRPERLQQIVIHAIESLARERGLTRRIGEVQCLSPGRPVPTHRMTADVQ